MARREAPVPAKMVEQILRREARRTQPDYVAYVPGSWDDLAEDRTNEHFLVFEGPGDVLMAIWTQSWRLIGHGKINRTMFSRSDDEGITWSRPRRIAGPKDRDDPTHMTSWAFPMVSVSGRIYVVYNRHQGVQGWIRFHTGTMAGLYSDDGGENWSAPQDIPMPHSPYDDPEGKVPPEWIVWQKPMRDPWCFCASYSRPHFPLTAPGRYVHKYLARISELPPLPPGYPNALHPHDRFIVDDFCLTRFAPEEQRRALAAYYACVEFADHCIGRLLDGLRSAGCLENTYVVYTSDHGDMAAEHGLWWKRTYYEASARVPLLIAGPDIPRGVTYGV